MVKTRTQTLTFFCLVGPLGAWFTVKKEHETYAPVIEETLGRTLRTFATDHPDDVNPLRHLIQEVYRNSNEGKPGITSVVSSNRVCFLCSCEI